MLSKLINDMYSDYNAEIARLKNAAGLTAINDKFLCQELLTIKDYEALLELISLLITKEKNPEKTNTLNATLNQLHTLGNAVVAQSYIKPDGRMPNASLIAGFKDPDTSIAYIILIENSKFKQFTTPAGKLDKTDTHLQKGFVDVDKTYQVGAIRKFCEEALSKDGAAAFRDLLHRTKLMMHQIDRDEYGIPELDRNYDTRLFTLDLGLQRIADIQQWLAPPRSSGDVAQAFILPVPSLSYDKLSAEKQGNKTNYFLTHQDANNQTIRLQVRPTTLIVLNGPIDKPELGFANAIGNCPTGSIHYSQQHTLLAPPKPMPNTEARPPAREPSARGQQPG